MTEQGGQAERKPLVVVTGAVGAVVSALVEALGTDYRVVGLDLSSDSAACEIIQLDLTSPASVELALQKLARRHGRKVASVVHLAAYFDFTGEETPFTTR